MGLLVGMIWITAGIAYIIYKFGSEELNGGAIGGTGCIIAVVVAFLVLDGFAKFCLSVTDNEADAGLLAWGIIFAVIIVGLVVHRIRTCRRDYSESSIKGKEEDNDNP